MKLLTLLILCISLAFIVSSQVDLSNQVNTENNRIKTMFSELACLAEFKDGKIYLINHSESPVDYGDEPSAENLLLDLEPRYVYHHPSKAICIFYKPYLTKVFTGIPKSVKVNHGQILDALEEELIKASKAKKKSGSIRDFVGGELWIQDGDLKWINNESGFFNDIFSSWGSKALNEQFKKFLEDGMLESLTDSARVDRFEDYNPKKGGIGKKVIYKSEKKRKLRKIK